MSTKKFSIGKATGILAVVVVILAAVYVHKDHTITTVNTEKKEDISATITPTISITQEDIKEENFSGSVAKISGSSVLATEAQKYIDQTISEFKIQADKDVPDMKKQFGADSPTASYTLYINAENIASSKTESVVMSVSSYTGGAHGNTVYKVITASTENEKILQLSDIIKEDKHNAFTEFVKKELKNFKQGSSNDPSPLFPEEVDNLKFESFQNWALDNENLGDENLILYFSQYEIGPGVLGPIAFPLPLTKIKDFLK